MSDFSLTLVLRIKTSKIINDMAKVQHKSEKISAFGGIFFVLDRFDRILSSVIDSHLGLRSKLIGYQYSEIIRAVFSVFCCGGNCMEDLNLYLKDVLTERPHTRVPSADMVLRGIEELATENKNHRDSLILSAHSSLKHKGYPIGISFAFSSFSSISTKFLAKIVILTYITKQFGSFSLKFLEVWRFIPIFAIEIYGLTLKTKTAYGNIATDIRT